MRIDRRLLHPKVWEAIDAYQWSLVSGDTKTWATYSAHQKAWWKEYGRGLMLGVGAYLGLIGCGVALSIATNSPIPGIAGIGITIGHSIVALLKNQRTVTVDELVALLPSLNLSELGRLYAEVVVGLHHLDMSASDRQAALTELLGIMEDDEHLTKTRESLIATLASHSPEEIAGEVREMEERLASASDPVAKQAYEQSLELARGRLHSFERHRPLLERIDAQREVLRQTLMTLRSDLGRARAPGIATPALDSTNLRAALMGIRNQAEEIERAVQELGA